MSQLTPSPPANSQPAVPAVPGRNSAMTWAARIALALLAGWMCVDAYRHQPSRLEMNFAQLPNVDLARAEEIVRHFVFEWGGHLAEFALAGLLVPCAAGALASRAGWPARYGTVLLAGLALCGVARGVQLTRVPAPAHLVLPLTAFLLGAWVGRALVRGPRAVLWLLPQLAAVLLLAVGLAATSGWLAMEDSPLPFEPTEVTMAAKRSVANALRGTRGGPQQGRHIRLTEYELNLLTSAGLARVAPAAKARLLVHDGSADAELSIGLPRPGGQRMFLNVRASGAATIDDGELSVRGDRLLIGSLAVPKPLLRLISPAVATAIRHDSALRDMIGSIATLRMEGAGLDAVFKPGECSDTFMPALAHALSGKPQVTAEVREHVAHLVAGAGELPPGDERFLALLQRAFRFARERSVNGDPAIENRAALLALAILLGHERVAVVVGPVLDDSLRETAQRELGGVTLRGRNDWTKHFLISAAITLMACEGTSDKIGVLKEILDAEDGGSGFSFGDMTANRAGTLLARASTYDADSARALQDRLAGEILLDAVFPEAADLPENLATADLQAQFGGTGGAEYRRLMDEIESRLSRCAALQ